MPAVLIWQVAVEAYSLSLKSFHSADFGSPIPAAPKEARRDGLRGGVPTRAQAHATPKNAASTPQSNSSSRSHSNRVRSIRLKVFDEEDGQEIVEFNDQMEQLKEQVQAKDALLEDY